MIAKRVFLTALILSTTALMNAAPRNYEIWGTPILPSFLFLLIIVLLGTELHAAHAKFR
jgi:hypothetical protein